MDIVVTYDVNTETKEGRRRLRHVAKICEGTGQRVQLSVFECSVSDVQLERLKQRLIKVIDPDCDSLRIYRLMGRRQDVVQAYGTDKWRDFDEPLLV